MDAFEVLRQLDELEDSDDDFDGYICEEDLDEDLEGDHESMQASEEQAATTTASEEPTTTTASTATSMPEYQGRRGCTVDMANKTPLDFFGLLVTEQMLEHIVQQTNLYAQQFLNSSDLRPRSRANLWEKQPHNIDELRKFLALVIVMGIIHFPSIEDYWVKSWPFSNSTFSSVLKRDRFTLLLKFLHLNDNSQYIPKGQPGHDPLYKIRPFMDNLIRNFQHSYIPGRELSLDESMIGFKGRLGFVQYMPKKPTKWGLKAFVLADGVTGYALNWKLYTGGWVDRNCWWWAARWVGWEWLGRQVGKVGGSRGYVHNYKTQGVN